MRVVGAIDATAVTAAAPPRNVASLEDVLRWAHATGGSLVEVIIQDEFTHDVIVASATGLYLCFDTT